MTTPHPGAVPPVGQTHQVPAGRAMRVVIWLAGLLVAVGAAVATAHGLYEVALAARVPAAIAWLYPLITDGLALVAYAASARLHGSAAHYAWSVVVLAAGLSGLAQAMFLASYPRPPAADVLPVGLPVAEAAVVAGPVFEASAALRFGVGAWPAVAAAIVAHLLYLLATDHPARSAEASPVDAVPDAAGTVTRSALAPAAGLDAAVHLDVFTPDPVQPGPGPVQSVIGRPVHPDPAVHAACTAGVQRTAEVPGPAARPVLAPPVSAEQADRRSDRSPARDRARAAASRHAHRHGALPTVSELEAAAQVSRGTAAAALKALREQPTPLHLITNPAQADAPEDDPTIEEHAQP